MNIREKIINIIKESCPYPLPIKDSFNLYTDLGFDSLGFVRLLLKIEEEFAVIFDLQEMEACLQIETLIALVRKKGNMYDS